MSGYDNNMKGAIWINEDKKRPDANPNLPHYKGSITIDGKEFLLSGWKREDGAHQNAPVVKFSVQAKDDVHKQGVDNASQAAQGHDDFDDSQIPF